ncbi:hypothetical protein Cni_G17910 [Canna indica]|uniref:Uncharacterized protein n=1 Tax=Canna indica TaxID=4628 RepID=A0AAQ3KJM9_9LILI|nr:hypothetical protein Cni_G17910 [Canna indica]
MKLREHVEKDIEAENEAFDRYIENVNLLEETFSTMGGTEPGNQTEFVAWSSEKFVSETKMKLKANSERADSLRERMRDTINQNLNELKKGEFACEDCPTYDDDLDDDCKDFTRSKKVMKSRYERNAAMNDMINKLNTARNEEDLKSCLDMKQQLLHGMNTVADTSNNMKIDNQLMPKQESKSETVMSCHPLPKLWTAAHVDENTIENINIQFSSLSQIAQL